MGMNIMRMKGRAKMMRTIKVTGKGKIAVKPDMIRLYVNKEELCKEYEDTPVSYTHLDVYKRQVQAQESPIRLHGWHIDLPDFMIMMIIRFSSL